MTDMLTSIGGATFPLASDSTIVSGLDSGLHTSVFSGHGPHPTPTAWGPSITNRGERKAMKRRMTATVTDAVAQLRATTAGLGEGYHSIRSWMGDWLVDSSLESMIPQVAASTAAQYDISVRQYFEFCTHASHTPWSDPFLLHLSTAEKGLWLSCWLHWQHDRGSSITQSCSGLRKFFEQNGQPIDFFDDPRLKQVKASTRPSAAAQLALRQRTEKSVVPIEFLWTVMHHFGPRESDVRSEFDRVKEIGLVAMVMYEYGYGLRIGNLAVSNGNSNHTLLCDHVIFHFADPDDANALPRAMYAHEVWQHGSEAWCSTSHLVSVTMTHPSGKNWGGIRQPKKSAVVNTVHRASDPTDGSPTEMLTGGFQDQLTAALFNHAVAARLQPGQCFFSVNRGHLNPRATSLANPRGNYAFQASDSAKLVKFAAVTHGLPPSHFSTTSWRATCATVLASMGETYLKMFGNWSSDIYLRYIRSVGKQTSAGDLQGISLKRIAVQIPIESQRAFNACHSASTADATPSVQRHATSSFTTTVRSLPEGHRTLFAAPSLEAQFQYTRGDYASASLAIADLPTGSHDREVRMLRTGGGHAPPLSHRSAPVLTSPTSGGRPHRGPQGSRTTFLPWPPATYMDTPTTGPFRGGVDHPAGDPSQRGTYLDRLVAPVDLGQRTPPSGGHRRAPTNGLCPVGTGVRSGSRNHLVPFRPPSTELRVPCGHQCVHRRERAWTLPARPLRSGGHRRPGPAVRRHVRS